MINNQLAIGILIMNIATFLLFGLDKTFAKEKMWRIPEAVLLGIALLGGSFGAYMQISLVNDGPFTVVLDSKELFG